jgi:hypothetical protein
MENVWRVVVLETGELSFGSSFFDSDYEWLILVQTSLSYNLNPTTPEPL